MPGYYGAFVERLRTSTATVLHSWQDAVGKRHSKMNEGIISKVDVLEEAYESSIHLYHESTSLYSEITAYAETQRTQLKQELVGLRE